MIIFLSYVCCILYGNDAVQDSVFLTGYQSYVFEEVIEVICVAPGEEDMVCSVFCVFSVFLYFDVFEACVKFCVQCMFIVVYCDGPMYLCGVSVYCDDCLDLWSFVSLYLCF